MSTDNAKPNDPAESLDILIHDELRLLQLNFAKHLAARVSDKDDPPTHQELSVIRAALRDNGMVIKGPGSGSGDDKEAMRRQAADLPEFDDDDFDA